MKRFLISLVFSLSLVSVFAQSTPRPYLPKPRFSLGPEFGFPTDHEFADLFRFGFGGSGALEIPVTRKFYLEGVAGFITYYLKSSSYDESDINKSYIPLKAGGKYYIKNYLYAEGTFGVSIGTQKNAGVALVYSPGAGVSIPVTKDGYLDIGGRFEVWDRDGGNLNQFAIKAAYKF
ncbi:hypothetical protein GS399_18335 [Pedobacter sp. HMF7647]|uniref:Outer membrane beta-barrel protein n=1 Tax=Hufsiella arboris TaxID=2695275 RepID=A0A7K1YEA2_9SPHI|nr:hypothetical protein [Hufsiella arboris]MXV52934.1 hypothetical protein [Hufsiella arboris]